MAKKQRAVRNDLWNRIKSFICENDIRALVFMPAVFGGLGSILLGLLIAVLTHKPLDPLVGSLILALGLCTISFGGVAEIVKREMPGPFGKVITGPIAVVSGILMILLFDGLGVAVLFFAIAGK